LVIDDAPEIDVDDLLDLLDRDVLETGNHRGPGVIDDEVSGTKITADIVGIAKDGVP